MTIISSSFHWRILCINIPSVYKNQRDIQFEKPKDIPYNSFDAAIQSPGFYVISI
jgi:hypothetical protein